ncbi:hypothetical protein, partial [Azospirillum griseum]
ACANSCHGSGRQSANSKKLPDRGTQRMLTLVDSKQREQRRVFWRDIPQLSPHRVILSNTDDERFAGLPVLPRAYVRIAGTRGVEYVPVGLLDTDQVMALWFEHGRRQAV